MTADTGTGDTRSQLATCAVVIVLLGGVGSWAIVADQARETGAHAPTVAPSPGSVASIHVPRAAIARVYPDMSVPPCRTEASHNCYWDAARMGNGHGRSFIDIDGHTYYAGAR